MKTKIPSKEDWSFISDGFLSDLDIIDSYELFFGKSNDEIQHELKENFIMRCCDLRWMPIKPFLYYIYAIKIFIESKVCIDDISSAVSCLFDLFSERAEKNHIEIREIFPDFYPLMKHIAENQDLYDADGDIYGSFKEQLAQIEKLLK